MNKKISLTSLIILIIAAIDNMRNLPSAALFGSSMIFFFALAAVVFLIPTALMAAELSATSQEEGGIYQWVLRAFGKKWAMAAIWLQWINTMVWYPTILSFIAGTIAYLIDPALAENRTYIIATILSVFWGMTLINLRGIHISTLLNNICCTIGTIIPLIFLILMGVIWYFSGQPLQITLTKEALLPPLHNTEGWVSLIAIMASFLGIELAGVHVNDIKNPQKNFPRALFIATSFIFTSMLLGSLSIAFVLDKEEINLIAGVMQVFSSFFKAFGMEWLMPIITLLIAVGSIGTMINWLISPAKGILHAAEFGFLPTCFTKKNSHGVAQNILLAQGVFVTIFCLLFLLEPSVNAFYWFLTALSTELYMIMYILMFFAGLKMHFSEKRTQGHFKIPGGNFGIIAVVLLGLFGCLTTIVVSFLPPEHVDIESPLYYFFTILLGNILTIAPLSLFYIYEKRKRRHAQ